MPQAEAQPPGWAQAFFRLQKKNGRGRVPGGRRRSGCPVTLAGGNSKRAPFWGDVIAATVLAGLGAIAALIANFTLGVERMKENMTEVAPEDTRSGDA